MQANLNWHYFSGIFNVRKNNSILDNWIKDFHLQSPEDGSICFNAAIQYETVGHFKQLYSEVHIVHIYEKGLTVLYLLEPEIVKQNIPEMLYFDMQHFNYYPHMPMEIKDIGPEGKYKMTITVKERICSDATKAELHEKKYN